MDLYAFLGGSIGAGAPAAFAIWMFKRWMEEVKTTLKKHGDCITEVKIMMAKHEGKDETEIASLKKDVEHQKEANTILRGRVDKAWETISKIANPRVSDAIDKSLGENK